MFHAKQPTKQLRNFKVASWAVFSSFLWSKEEKRKERDRDKSYFSYTQLQKWRKNWSNNQDYKKIILKKKNYNFLVLNKNKIQIITKNCNILHIVSYLFNSYYTSRKMYNKYSVKFLPIRFKKLYKLKN